MKIIPILLFWILTVPLFAQESENFGFIPIELGVRKIHFRDQFSSPNLYKGWGLLFGLGNEKYKDNSIVRYGGNTAFVSASSQTKTAYSLENNVIDGNFYYSYQPRLEANKDVGYFVGLRLDFIISNRDERPTSFDGSFTLSAVGTATFRNEKDWFYTGSVRLPLLAYSRRPPAATTGYYLADKEHHKKYFSKFMTLPQYFGVDFKVEMTKITSKGNGLRGTYRWRYYQITPVNKIQMMQSDFRFGLLWGYDIKD